MHHVGPELRHAVQLFLVLDTLGDQLGYGTWLAHCRERAHVDDHPLFTDYAPDDRWKVWE